VRVALAGATGAIGRQLVPPLLAAGHEVTGLTSRESGRGEVEALGAHAVVADAFDAGAVAAALAEAHPEVVVHQLTRIPADVNPRTIRRDFELNDRLREEGTRNLVAGALAAGARRMVAQSVCFFYAPGEGPPNTEDDPLWPDPPSAVERTVRALGSLERQVTGSDGLEGVVLRYGYFYGPGTSYAPDGGQAAMVRKRRFPIVGDGSGRTSFVHVADAAEATVAALGAAPGIYNVCDDEPAAQRDWLPAYAEAIGAPAPRRVPALVARLAAGPALRGFTGQRGASNAKARAALGWAPAHASWRTGFAAVE
jgi:nucleoside-diphosphate-sugar epimerase